MKTPSAPLMMAAALFLFPLAAHAQGTAADYERAIGLREKYQALALHVPEPAHWIG
jgi:hypothetical protein